MSRLTVASLLLVALAAVAQAGLLMVSRAVLFLSSGGGETITWTAVTDPSFAGYRVYYGTSSGVYSQNPGSGISTGTTNSYDASALSGTYYFVVVWVDERGNESPPSNELQKVLP